MKIWPFAKPGPDTPISRAVFAVLDLEMTGLNPERDHIIALGGLIMHGGRIRLGQDFSQLVRPKGRPSPESILVHQLTWADLEDKPRLEEILPQFLEFIDGAVLAGWHLDLDLAFLTRQCRLLGLDAPKAQRLDVLGLYQAIRGHRGSNLLDGLPLKDANLYTVARALGIEPKGAHAALGDAYLTAQVLQRFLAIAGSNFGGTEPSLETILRLSKRGPAQSLAQVGF